MNTQAILRDEDTFLIPTYKKMPVALVRGDGCYVWDSDGKRYLDFYGGHCVTPLGHCPPRVVDAIKQQSDRLLFYSNVVYSDVRARAARLLAEMAPLKRIFFCNSGTEAIETALKIARKSTGRSEVVSMIGAFHGRTLGSLATAWNPGYRAPFKEVLANSHFLPIGDLAAAGSFLTRNNDIAAVLIEPVQSIAGMVSAPVEYFQGLRKLCDSTSTLLIFDEVQTGVGRTGTFSISEQFGIVPDMITLAKSLGSGIPVGATLLSETLSDEIQFGDQGSTFGGGMIAMSAVEATLQSIREDNLMNRAPIIFDAIKDALQPFALEMRGHGCLIGVRIKPKVSTILPALREHGVLAGSSADPHVMRLMPPLIAGAEQIAEFAEAFRNVVEDVQT
ncbi:MAG: aspartate aminotransferase family protein [Rhodothermaceae bacterium]|nr:aspartate aminotransferase family protein [Rhodothermaceae bacterium]MXX58487.1 aspartate aminotransferase family protein [Rhodothermaceae bacterium]MYD20345.1 aspartate aminotransferase family protein [Rhodothermaceae bacterium]MYD56699.1 aspartate aminotransferase family protein [Rhodothermaceae bacterium]MYI43235.1 aspartate aminotransferase family protein [Rhodothermaceae bacterium]